jgi:hypothetical protein
MLHISDCIRYIPVPSTGRIHGDRLSTQVIAFSLFELM